ncbi:MAG TPA: hypothetical protein VIY48_18040 [Candidatus Paceibacterota bacterium]
MHKKTRNELRCFCSRNPLLATYGLTETGELYIHVKVYKQARVYGEVLVTNGTVKLHCRECLRWHKVVMRVPGKAELVEDSVDVPPTGEVVSHP